MSNIEQDLLTRDLNKAESKEEVESIMESAEILGHENIVQLAQEKLQAINRKTEAMTNTEAKVYQVEELGGTKEEIEKRTQEVDQRIQDVKKEIEQKISETTNVETNTPEGMQQKEDRAELELDKIREKIRPEGEGKVIVDNKYTTVEELQSNPEIAKKVDWHQVASLRMADQLLEKKLVSPKDILKGLNEAQIPLLQSISLDALKQLKEQEPIEFNTTLETIIKNNSQGLDDRRWQMTYLANMVRLPGGPGAIKRLGLENKMFQTRDAFIKSSNENPARMLQLTEGLPALFDTATKGLVPREDLMRWIKEGLSGENMQEQTFRELTRNVLMLEQQGKISKEEAGSIIKSSPYYKKYLE